MSEKKAALAIYRTKLLRHGRISGKIRVGWKNLTLNHPYFFGIDNLRNIFGIFVFLHTNKGLTSEMAENGTSVAIMCKLVSANLIDGYTQGQNS